MKLSDDKRVVLSAMLDKVWPDLISDAHGRAEAYHRAAVYLFAQAHPGSRWEQCADPAAWRRLARQIVDAHHVLDPEQHG